MFNSSLDIAFDYNLSLAMNCSVEASINGTDLCPKPDDGLRPFVSSVVVQIIWSILFSSMVIGAVCGNLMVIYIILNVKNMRTKTNVFFLNLSMADLLMATLNAMFNFIYMINSDWIFGYEYCKINNFVANLTVSASVFTIMATSIDRYIVVLYPLRPRITKRTSTIVVVAIWLVASVIALPALINSQAISFTFANDEKRTVCVLIWSDGIAGNSRLDNIYNIILFVVTYLLPMICMSITYTIMARVLWGSKTIGEMSSAQRAAISAKQRVVPTLITVTIVFGICWFPYHLYFLYIHHNINITSHVYVQHLYLLFYFLAMLNSLLNPIIYCLLNQRFRHHFKRILFCEKMESERSSTITKKVNLVSTKENITFNAQDETNV